MAKLFPDSTRLPRASRPISPTPASTTKPQNEEQLETVTATGGTRVLTVDGQSTSAIAFDAIPATIKAALEALSNVAVNDVTVSASVAANEIQTVTLGAGNTGGNFTLSFDGQTTGNIAYNAVGATVQTALVALSNIAPADVVVTGGAGGPYIVTFGGVYAGLNVPAMTSTPSLTGGANTAVVATSANVTTNKYLFIQAFQNKKVDFRVNPASLTGGTASIRVSASGFDRTNAREATKNALASKGLVRSSDLVANDIEKLSQRKPKDIGEAGRIAGEP